MPGVGRQPIGVFGEAVSIPGLDPLHHAAMQGPTPLLKQAAVRHLVREGVLECVFEIGEKSGLVQELGGLEPAEALAQGFLALVCDRLEEGERDVLADHGGRLKKPLVLRGEAIDSGSQNGLSRCRDLHALGGLLQPVRPPLAGEALRLDKRSHALFEEEGVPLCPLDEQPFERPQRRSGAEQRRQHLLGALGRQRIDAQLAIVRLAPPAVPVLGAIVHEHEQPRRREAFNQAVKQGLGLRVNPVEVLEENHERLDLAFAQE